MKDQNIQIDYDAIKEFVEQALKEKEDEKLKAAIEELLTKSNETIESLTSLVDVKDQAIQDLEVELSNFKEELEKVNETVEEKEKALEEATNKAEELEKELAEMKKDLVLVERVKVLEEASVLRSGKALDIQKAKIREMTDEDFEAYKEELVAIRKELEEELKKNIANKNNKDDKDKATASLNLEDDTDDDVKVKYKKLGKALAEYISKKED